MKSMPIYLALALVVSGVQAVRATEDTEILTSSGDLEAVFTPTGEGRWGVALHFSFQRTLQDGKFRGTHAEITNGQERKTGRLTLKK